MTSLIEAITLTSQLYNVIFIFIALILFWILFKTPSKNTLYSWKLLFVAFLLLAIKEILIILRANSIVNPDLYINGLFDLGFIAIFLYTILQQK